MAQIARLRDAQIQNGLSNNADDVDVEIDQLVASHNDHDTKITDILYNPTPFVGLKTFNSGIEVNSINEVTSGVGVTIDSVLLKDGMVKVAGTPTVDGQIGYASNQFLFRENGTNRTISTGVFGSTFSVNTNSTLGSTAGAVILASGFITLSIPVYTSLETRWFTHIQNEGTGEIVIDPNGAETINGASTLKLYPGESCLVMLTGTGAFTATGIVRKRPVMIFSVTASGSSTVDFTGLDSGIFTDFYFELKNIVPATDASSLYMRFSTNGGSSYAAGASDYTYAGDYGDSAGGTSTPVNSTGAAQILLGPANFMGNSTGEAYSSTVKLTDPLNTSAYKHVTIIGGQYSSTPRGINLGITGHYVGSQSAVNAVRFLMNTGNITSGVFECWGIRA